jgi:2,4-dienoyl-CoA reductase-like NADH-dependent reductase (Old Yellow Enzyme family)
LAGGNGSDIENIGWPDPNQSRRPLRVQSALRQIIVTSSFRFAESPVMALSPAPLFTPFRLKNLTLPNRFVMAPMTRSKSPGQITGPEVAAYYRRRSEGGVGLIITEGTSPEHHVSSGDVNVPAFFGDESLKGWANVLKEVRAAGGLIMPQLWHQGILRKPGSGPRPELPSASPSGLLKPDKKVGNPMSDAEVADVISGFAKSAGYAKQLGFDGVEIHGAHGYIIDQFFWHGTNTRADKYGGSMVDRTRFAAEIISEVRRAVGPDFPVILRWSQWKQQDYAVKLAPSPKDLEAFLAPLTSAGVDCYHCSTRRFWEPEFDGSELNLAGWVKKISGKPTITVGSVGLNQEFIATYQGATAGPASLDRLIEMFERGDFDLVGVGRAILVDAAWVNKVRDGRMADLLPYSMQALQTLS